MPQLIKRVCFSTIVMMTILATPFCKLNAQVPTYQDCLGAIPVCLGTYTSGALITGTGNYPNEINPVNSCLLTGERNDSWYIVTTTSSGNLNFSIIPVNPTHNYDWAIYDLTSAVCSDIFTNPSLEIACNYSNAPGVTGANGLPGTQNHAVIPVSAGKTFVINVSGFSSINQAGYTLDFTASTCGINDNAPPSIVSVTSMNCGATTMNVSFSERVLCSSVQASDFTLTGPGGPFTITSVTGTACTAGADYGRDYTITFSPAIPGAGNYTINLVGQVSDLCGNNANVPQAFQMPISGLSLTFQTVDVTCFGGNNGSATVNVTGAPGPYSYQWSPMGGSQSTAQFLTSGTYTVTVTSGMGCTASASVQVTQPLSGMTASSSVTPANGCAANGTASVNVQNGQPPYTYSWWPTGGNAATATGLTSGGYMVTISDANQCVLNYFLNVPSANGPSVNISSTSNVSCFGGNDGSATVTVSNATGPFSYTWSPSGGNAATATGLSAGNYTVEVIVAPGCTLTTGVTIVQPPSALSTSISSSNTTCGNNNGSINLTASGGAGSYTYQWTPNITTGTSASGLAGGTYTITVTDGNGCTDVQTVNIAPSSQPVPTLTNHMDVSCNGLSDGATGVIVNGGMLPLTFQWSSGSVSSALNNIPAGTYTVTVTDAAGCTATLTDIINQPAPLTLSSQSVTHVLCYGDLTGAATVTASGGNGGNTFAWSGNASTTGSIVNAPAGNYTVTVTDAMGCNTSIQLTITQPQAALSLSGNVTETTCGNNDGAVNTIASGGTAPYQYQWNTGATTGTISSLGSGIYTLTVTDQNGCITQQTYTVQSSNAPLISVSQITPVSCAGGSDGSISLNVNGGTAPYTWNWNGISATGSSATGLPAGIYNVSVTDATGCTAYQQYTINQPDPINITMPVLSTICIGGSAQIIPVITGGTTPYSFMWSTGSSSAQINVSPVVTSTYNLTVSDAYGCEVNAAPVIIDVYPALQVTVNYPDSVCTGTDVTVSVTGNGGDGNYFYSWSNGMTGSVNNILISQNTSFNITMTDGCTTPSVQSAVQITAVEAPDVNFGIPVQSGCAPLDAKFEVPPGLPSGLIYIWDFGDGYTSTQVSPSHTYTDAGIYMVTLKIAYSSAPSCNTVLNFPASVLVYQVPVARFIFDPPAPTLNSPDVFFTDRSTGAVNWLWDFGDGSNSHVQNPRYAYSDTGSFVVSLRVQSNEGCLDSTYNIVEVKDEMQVWIPNAFTPDASGVNDYFQIYGVGFVSYELMIFDRWGKLVYVSKNNEKAWDGTDMETGEPVPQGLYVYKVTIIDNNGNVHNRFNHVTVIR